MGGNGEEALQPKALIEELETIILQGCLLSY